MHNNCVFCGKFKEDSGDIIHFEPLSPVVKGHLLVVHRKHTKDFTNGDEVFAEVAKYAARLARDLGGDWNLITSKGINATQSVFHLHIHLVPRIAGDGLVLPWTNQIKEPSSA